MNINNIKNIKVIKGKGTFPTSKIRKIYPSKALLWKFYLQIILSWLVMGCVLIIGDSFFQIYVQSFPKRLIDAGWSIYWFGSLIAILPAVFFTSLYVRNMEYIVHGDEIIVKKGIFNRTVKYCPFRTVTNISTRVGPFDRVFRVGNVFVQTAGRGGAQRGPEEKLEGLPLYDEIRNYILKQLQLYDPMKYGYMTIDKPTDKKILHKKYITEVKELKTLFKEYKSKIGEIKNGEDGNY